MGTRPFFIEGIGGMKVEGASELPGATICLHGGPGGNCLSLYPFFPADRLLGDWYFADIPNHGRSEGTDGDWSREACIARLERFADRLQGPLRVVGHSWGGHVALEWAHAHSERFKAFVAMSAPGNADAIEKYQATAMIPPHVLSLMERFDKAEGKEREYLSNLLYVEMVPITLRDNPCLEACAAHALELSVDLEVNMGYSEGWSSQRLRPALIREQLGDLNQRGVPALIIWGAEDRCGDAPCHMGHYANGTGAELRLMEEAGHNLFADFPDRFFPALNDFFLGL